MAAISQGTSGNQVSLIQQKVGIRSDGYYDRNTKLAVKAWQASKGLPATGIVDDATLDAMFPSVPEEVQVTPQEVAETPQVIHEENGSEENKADDAEVERILSGRRGKVTDRSTSHSG